jgi:hypothetical protein
MTRGELRQLALARRDKANRESLTEAQESLRCEGCKFADRAALKKRTACCTFLRGPHPGPDGVCVNRKVEGLEAGGTE